MTESVAQAAGLGATHAVVACSACRQPWAVELRHATVACPRCGERAELAGKALLWQGTDARAAQEAVARQRAPPGVEEWLRVPKPARHDSRVEAAAAAGRGIANKSLRAEAVVASLSQGQPDVAAEELQTAMVQSGLDVERARLEVVRMLARDILMEPRPGRYRPVGA